MTNEWRELVHRRNRTSKTKQLYVDNHPTDRYSWDGQVGTSLHYEETEGDGQWLAVDPRIVLSTEPGWDWEMHKSHWRLLIRNNGWVGIARGGMGLGFRLLGWTFLNIATKEYQAVRDATYSTPVVAGSELVWQNIYPGVSYKLMVGPDGLTYVLTISQTARDAVPASPYPVADTFFVYVYQVLWGDCPYTADVERAEWLDDRDAPWEPGRGLYLVDALGKVKACLPLGWALSVGEMEPVALKHRYVRRNGNHYLLNGARWDTLKGLPAGEIVLSTNLDCGYFKNG